MNTGGSFFITKQCSLKSVAFKKSHQDNVNKQYSAINFPLRMSNNLSNFSLVAISVTFAFSVGNEFGEPHIFGSVAKVTQYLNARKK